MGMELLLQGLLPPLVLLHHRDNALRLPADPREGDRLETGRRHPGRLPAFVTLHHDDLHPQRPLGVHRGTPLCQPTPALLPPY
jgi:hypothetical protein